MTQPSPDNSLLADRIETVRNYLTGDSVTDTQLCEIATDLALFGELAAENSRSDLQAGADMLSRISELAANWYHRIDDENQLGDELLRFLETHVTVLNQAIESPETADEISLFVRDAEDRWSQQLASLECGELTNHGWDADASDAAPQVDEDLELPNDQIQLMLAALSGSDASTVVDADPPRSSRQPSAPASGALSDHPFSDQSPNQTAIPNSDNDEAARRELASDRILLEAYLDDALRCLSSMEQAAFSLEESPNHEQIRQFCRELHTLKGASASVGLSNLASELHALESSLEGMFEGPLDDLDVDRLFSSVDRVRQVIGSLQEAPGESASSESSTSPVDSTATRASAEFSAYAAHDDASIRIRAANLDRLMDMLAELVVLRNRREGHVTEYNELNEELARCAARVSFTDERWERDGLDAVDAGSVNSLLRSTSHMSEVSKDIAAVSRGLRDLQKPVVDDNIAISRFIRDFRQELMQLRRVPVSGLFTRLQRAARDAARSEGKQVQVKLIGEHAGLEQEIQERLYDSLLHVVRNSVSHGIEVKADRLQAGKSPVGTITLEANSNAQLLIIEVRDDGGGLDYDAIRRRAAEKGLLNPHQRPTDEEAGKLIFHPGFSTRTTASQVSGRGIGMDIVSTTVEQLRGRIEVTSTAGLGTTMRLLIPLRTGIEHVMVFRAGGQLFALPMQCVTAAKSSKSDLERVSLAAALSLNQHQEPGLRSDAMTQDVLVLRHARKVQTGESNQDQGSNSQRMALGVDELIGPEEVVVRGLPNLLKNHPLFCGITLSGSGEKVLLLDAERLAGFCQNFETEFTGESGADRFTDSASDQHQVLIVDDSLTARKVLGKLLRNHGLNVTEAGDGVEAIEHLHRQSFDLVITDLDMPRMGGLELLTDIQTGQYCHAKVAVVSSRNEQTFQDKATELGVELFISKPVTDASITNLLAQLEMLPELTQG